MDLPNTRRAFQDILAREVARRAQLLRNEVVETLSRPGAGQTYGIHTASAPGDPPAVDTGRLRQSITALQITPFRWRVGTNVDYALALEFGTKHMAPRPYLRPSVEAVKGK